MHLIKILAILSSVLPGSVFQCDMPRGSNDQYDLWNSASLCVDLAPAGDVAGKW